MATIETKFRIKKLVDILTANHADAFLLINSEGSGQPGTQYLSGFSGSASMLLIAKKDRCIVSDGRYYEQIKKEAPSFELITEDAQGTLTARETLIKLLKKMNIRSVLVDGTRTTHGDVEKVSGAVRGLQILNKENILEELRIVKSAGEIVLIKKAGAIALRAFKKLRPFIKPGATEQSLAARLEYGMKEAGAEEPAFYTIVASGKNGAFPHARPTNKKLKSGELVTFDFGARYKGYHSDITRTLAVGVWNTIPAKLKEIYDVVQSAETLGRTAACAGMTGNELDAICRDYIAGRGFGKYFIHGTGHGLGMEVHEMPRVNHSNPAAMPAGAVITCEPGIYIKGLGGVRIENDLLLAKSGAVNLTQSQ